ncbi:MAG TPA: rhodanese-like domain-containing protein [Candidatus Baltobacteraceae bacterium]|nr:rhodanese-like domain-containing protein [Candidatus Baltobacteraceae bacterium]
MIGEISVDELARWRREGKAFVLLDVREPDEIAIARIADSVWIPMREIPARIRELDPAVPVAVYCHHGGRSERVAAFLAAQGFSDVVNVDGGIDAYAERIEPALARY